jgi:RND family efflux transporter MFP subunit
MKKITTFIFCSALVLFVGCKNVASEQAQQQVERIEVVETTILKPVEVSRDLDFSTTLQGYEKMSIAPSLTGRIEHIYVEVGSRIKKGDNLVLMDQQQYNTTALTHANLVVELGRMSKLIESGAVSQQNYDQIKLSLDQTKVNMDFLERNTFVKAQFDGVISAKNYEDGELYSGQAILELTQINQLKALVAIPESFFPAVKKGMKVDIKSDIYPNKSFPATIEIVYPTIDPASHTFQVKVRIPNSSELLRPGMYVHSTIALGKTTTYLMPYQSVQKLLGSNERYIYLNNDGIAKRVFVEVGQRFDDMVEVIAPEVVEGVEVISVGAEKLVDGMKIKITKVN